MQEKTQYWTSYPRSWQSWTGKHRTHSKSTGHTICTTLDKKKNHPRDSRREERCSTCDIMLDQARSAQGKSRGQSQIWLALCWSRLIEHDITRGTAFFSPRISMMVLFFVQGIVHSLILDLTLVGKNCNHTLQSTGSTPSFYFSVYGFNLRACVSGFHFSQKNQCDACPVAQCMCVCFSPEWLKSTRADKKHWKHAKALPLDLKARQLAGLRKEQDEEEHTGKQMEANTQSGSLKHWTRFSRASQPASFTCAFELQFIRIFLSSVQNCNQQYLFLLEVTCALAPGPWRSTRL